jgi:MFS family permease
MANIFVQPCDEGVIRSRPSSLPGARSGERSILAATILGSSLAFIDGTVINVALPALQQTLSATAVEVLWVVESYAHFLAALLLVGGSMGDRFGRRRIFCAGVALFALASIACGAALSINQLVIARALQGAGGALLVPGSLAIISAYGACSNAWGSYINGSLRSLITTGKGQPNQEEKGDGEKASLRGLSR